MMRKCLSLIGLILIVQVLQAEETGAENPVEQVQNVQRAAYLDPELKTQQALADVLKPHEIVWLDVNYPEKNEARKVLAIAHPPLIPDKQGAILLLHDKEQHADWPEVIHPLRMNLPKSGWYTLSLSLPDETRLSSLPRELDAKTSDQVILSENLKKNLDSGIRVRGGSEKSDDEQASLPNEEQTGEQSPQIPDAENQSANDEPVDIDLAAAQKIPDLNKIPYKIRAISHIQKAYEYIQSQTYQNIVMVAYGHSSELALQYIKAHLGELRSPGFSLVLIEPSIPEAYLLDLSEWLGKDFQSPILEIINRGDAQANMDAEYRKLSALRAGVQSYKQLFLTVNSNEIFDENLTRRIRSWLEINAPGMKVGL